MPRSRTRVPAVKADRYFSTLCKHFAKKVDVDFGGLEARVCFPMGTCRIGLDDGAMIFACEAGDADALARVQDIIDSHVTNFRDLRGTTVEWTTDE